MMPPARLAGRLGWTQELAVGLFHRQVSEALFMSITAYLDESGTHGQESPAVVMACFLATADQWAAYERDLRDLLSAYKVAAFHAKELRGGKGDFKGWSRSRKAEFNSQFLRLADDHVSAGFAVVLSSKDYSEIYRAGALPRRSRPDTPYALCFRIALWKALLYMKEHRALAPLTVVLEIGHKNLGDALRVFGEVQRSLVPGWRSLLGAVAGQNKESCPPLAIADSLAYSIFRQTAGLTSHPTPNVISAGPAYPPHIVKIPMSRMVVDRETLAFLRAQVTANEMMPISLPDRA